MTLNSIRIKNSKKNKIKIKTNNNDVFILFLFIFIRISFTLYEQVKRIRKKTLSDKYEYAYDDYDE